MKPFVILAAAAGAVLALASNRSPDPVTWHTDLDQARILAGEQGRPLLLVFR